MVNPDYIPDRGDIVWLNFDPQSEHEQKGKRPALVISYKIYNEKTGLALFCPITSKIKGYPFEVIIEDKLITGVVLADQIKNLDWNIREAKYITKISEEKLKEVLKKIFILIK